MELATSLALVAMQLGVMVVLARALWRILRPALLVVRARYDEAIAANDVLARSWLRFLPAVRLSAIYSKAVAYHLKGDLETSADLLAALASGRHGRVDANLGFAIGSLAAENQILRGEVEGALELVERTRKVRPQAKDALFAALALLARGDVAEADARFAEAPAFPSKPPAKLGRIVLFWDADLEVASFFLFRGMYLDRRGRADEARASFERAATVTKPTVYGTLARQHLEAAPTPDEVPGSLSPVVTTT